MKIAISHLWHAMELKSIRHLTVKDKVGEQHILGKCCNCNSLGVKWIYSTVRMSK